MLEWNYIHSWVYLNHIIILLLHLKNIYFFSSVSTSKLVMEDILTDLFVQRLSKKIIPGTVTPEEFSTSLGLGEAVGAAAAQQANVDRNQQSKYQKLISKYVMKNGRTSESALNLRGIFLESEMKDCANFVKAGL